ncbi:MAG: hypothetical protein ABI573_05985 [Chloroflexota bacterium]
MSLGPVPVLALLLGTFHVSVYVLIRGSAGQRLPWLILAAFLGAWAGNALGARLGIEFILIGDFHVIAASALAWVGIAGVAIVAILGPQPERDAAAGRMRTTGLSSSRFRRLPAPADADPEPLRLDDGEHPTTADASQESEDPA